MHDTRVAARRLSYIQLAAALFVLVSGSIRASDPLHDGFIVPPNTAAPRVWWHWLNGNVTEEGVRRDIDWMRRVGIGGVQMFDASFLTPSVIIPPADFMSSEWAKTFRYAVNLTHESGLEFAIASSPGWSESGGPWVHPDQAMKKLVWSEVRIPGRKRFFGQLPRPPATIGPFQNAPVNWDIPGFSQPPAVIPNELYKDVAVIAYRLPTIDHSIDELSPEVVTSNGRVDGKTLWDGNLQTQITLPFGATNEPAWIQIEFPRPETIHSMSLSLVRPPMSVDRSAVSDQLQVSQDGITFKSVVIEYGTTDAQRTVTFPPVTGRYFRLLLPTPIAQKLPEVFSAPPRQTAHVVAELVLHTTPRIDLFERKAGFFLDANFDDKPTTAVSPRLAILRADIKDITSYMQPDGTLNWTPPAGRWTVMRFGFSLIGTTNHPASLNHTGLEVDKLSGSAVRSYFNTYVGYYDSIFSGTSLKDAGVSAMVNDSWEAGAQNWTDDLPGEFQARRGYNLRLWLPALAGRILGGPATTERFLWDFRRTLGELLTENHYDQITTLLHARGMSHYAEAHELGRQFIGDGMDAKRGVDIPTGAMWTESGQLAQSPFDSDLRESASVAHIYGQNIVAAESFTAIGVPGAAYAFAPEQLVSTANRELADGVNRFLVHTSVHQPLLATGPGFTLGPYGTWFTRNETWAEQSRPWITYLSRCSYLLQQGQVVADVLYFYGQDRNLTALYASHLPAIPDGYAFDFANDHSLSVFTVRNGLLGTKSGMRYRVLAIDPSVTRMSVDVLMQIARLVSEGATLVGARPLATPSLTDSDAKFTALVNSIWGSARLLGEHHYGKGTVISGLTLSAALPEIGVNPDFSYAQIQGSETVGAGSVAYVHRRLADGDLYFVANRLPQTQRINASFRIADHAPEIWRPDSGVIEAVSFRQEGERTVVPLSLDPNEAVFVLFRERTQQRSRQIEEPIWKQEQLITGPWQLSFQPGHGAPEKITLQKLEPWNTNSDPGIRYFSGTATYDTVFEWSPREPGEARRIELDLGAVKNIAEVFVNGGAAGIAWKPPFRLDITSLIHAGNNKLEIQVTNLWPNRLIGDRQPNAKAIAFTTFNPYKAESPLLDSGLLGPVALLTVSRN